MKVLMLSLDKNIFDKNSRVFERMFNLCLGLDKLSIIVPSSAKVESNSDKLTIYSSGGKNKIFQFYNIYKLSKSILENSKFSVITSQDQYFLGLLAYWLAKKHKIALEIQVHGWEKYSRLRKIIAKFVLKKASGIRTVSQLSKAKIIKETKVNEDKIELVPIYNDLKVEGILSKEIPKEEFIFLTVGRLVQIKNISLQLAAIKNLLSKYNKVKLLIVGEGEEKPVIESLISSLGLTNKVVLLGNKNKEELTSLYSQADCFVLTSNEEGWGMVNIEAASFGLPIITTAVGNAEEVFKNNFSAIIIQPNDLGALTQAMEKIYLNTELAKELGVQAFKSVSKYNNLQTYLDNITNYWRKIQTITL